MTSREITEEAIDAAWSSLFGDGMPIQLVGEFCRQDIRDALAAARPHLSPSTLSVEVQRHDGRTWVQIAKNPSPIIRGYIEEEDS